jgi:ribosomal-protein-alanine N-acetyltransferase
MTEPLPGSEQLLTARLSLRRPALSDVGAIFLINSDPRACQHNPSDAIADRGQAHRLFQRWDEHWRRHGFGYWIVRRHGSESAVGICGIKVMQLHGTETLNLFYRFDPVVWGNGLATEAASAVTAWAAEHVPGRAVIARVRPQNLASQHVAARAGLARAEHLDAPGEDGPDWIFIARLPCSR